MIYVEIIVIRIYGMQKDVNSESVIRSISDINQCNMAIYSDDDNSNLIGNSFLSL